MFERSKAVFSRGMTSLEQYPATSFFILLVLLFGVIALGNFLRAPETISDDATTEPKKTALFDTAKNSAFVTVPGKAKKESVVHIVALAPGVVSNIFVTPGRFVASGQTLLTLTNDYQSGSAAIQKSLALEGARLTEELAKIDKRITQLEEKKTRHDDTLSSTEEDIELAELKKNRATRKSTLEQSAMTVQLANVSDAVLKPKTFASGIVESIRVKRGDFVTAGQTIATVATPRGATTLETFLDGKTARLFDATAEATVTIGSEKLTLRPTYFSQSENEQGLFSVLFTLSEDTKNKIISGEFLKVSLPLKSKGTATTLVPIDAIFQDDSHASVLVERDGIATSITVTLGNIYGGFAEVYLSEEGLTKGDHIILNRSVIAGDRVASVQ